MRSPRIVIEQFPNDLIRDFHVNERIASEKVYDSLQGAASLRFKEDDISPDTMQTILTFYEIDGVISVAVDIYEVRVTISRAFDWEEIIPQVIERIKKALRWNDCEVREHDSRPSYEGHRPASEVLLDSELFKQPED